MTHPEVLSRGDERGIGRWAEVSEWWDNKVVLNTHIHTHPHTQAGLIKVWPHCDSTETFHWLRNLPSAVGSCLHHLNQTSVSIRHFSVTTEIMRKPNPTSMKTRQYPMCVNIVAPRYDITFEERQEKGEVGWSPTGSLGCLTVIKHSGKTV